MKAIKLLTLGAILLFTSTSFASISAKERTLLQPGDWVKLGSKIVDMKADHDVIPVTIMDGVFTKVKLKVMKAPIHLLNMNIIFGNGENKNVVFNKHFEAGSSTRIIDLPGNKRIIKRVNLNYKSAPTAKGRAVITLFGKH